MMKSNHIILLVCILFGLQSPIAAQSSDWVYSPYAQYLTNDTTIPPPVGEPADAALSCFRHDTIYVLVMPTGQLYIWLRPDPLMDENIDLSPYVYCHGNPLVRIDPDGRADYYDIDGNHLCNDGVADNRVFQQNQEGDVVLGGYAIPFSYVGDVTSVKLEFNGEMEKKNHMAIGQLSLKQIGDNFEFVRASFDALSGTIYSNDCLPNGDYNTFKFQNRTDKDAMIRDGVGFSINLTPQFDTKRDLLRIHPDGGKVTGTEGCIGLTGNQSDLNSFVNLMRPLYSSYGNIPLNVNVKNNPNYHHF